MRPWLTEVLHRPGEVEGSSVRLGEMSARPSLTRALTLTLTLALTLTPALALTLTLILARRTGLVCGWNAASRSGRESAEVQRSKRSTQPRNGASTPW